MNDHEFNRDGHEELEENRDGLMLLLFGVVALGLLCAASAGVYFVANHFLGDDAPAGVAEAETQPTQPVIEKSEPDTTGVVPNSTTETALAEASGTAQPATGSPVTTPEESKPAVEDPETAAQPKKVWPPRKPTEVAAAPGKPDEPPVKKPDTVASTGPPQPVTPAVPSKPEPTLPESTPAVTPKPEPPKVATTKPEVASPPVVKPEPPRKVTPEPPKVVVAAGEPLVYNWSPGRIHSWTISMKADFEDETVEVNGHTQLSIGEPVQPPQASSQPENDATGTGTGFVISPDGYLVTCAHVVQGASKVEVQIGDKKYAGKVIAVVGVDDLAIVKIEAKDLPVLPIADSSKIQLGEEILAIGFPLTDVLGEGLKASRGTIAGIIQKQNGTRFQIDAAINPGNSGGPVVNQRGQMIGVASSKLVGLQISRLGFCIPSERVAALLKKEKIEGTVSANGGEALSGPDLVSTVAPSIALLKVTIGNQGITGQPVRISTSGSFNISQKSKQQNNRVIFRPSLGNHKTDNGFLVVDRFGEVEEFDAANQLPFLGGSMPLLAVHPFDETGRTQWSRTQETKIVVQKSRLPFGITPPRRPPSPFGRRPFGRDPFTETVKELRSIHEQTFEIESDSAENVIIGTTMSLRTLDSEDKPYLKITGKGTITFNRPLGMVTTYEFRETYERNDEDGQTRVPVLITATREEDAALRQRILKMAQLMAVAAEKSARTAAEKPVESPEQQLDVLLAKIAEDKSSKRSPAGNLYSLERMTVVAARQEEVEALLIEELANSDFTRQLPALKALSKWGTKNSIPKMSELVGSSNISVAFEAIRALGATESPDAIPALVEALRSQIKGSQASQALVKFGPACEEQVIGLLGEADRNTFRYTCDVLRAVGSEKSVEALEAAVAATDDFGRKSSANRALADARKRADIAAATKESGGQSPNDLKLTAALKTLAAENSTVADKSRALVDIQSVPPVEKMQEQVETALLEQVNGQDKSLQTSAVSALNSWATVRSAAAMIALAQDTSFTLRPVAMTIVERTADVSSSEALAEMAADPLIQDRVIRTLNRTGLTADAEVVLIRQLEKANDKTRSDIVGVLSQHGTEAGLTVLEASLNDAELTQRFVATANAIARIRVRVGLTAVE
ncbi:MAG: trypsin-like peptidase domain-containing protein [Planctomycetota bacterium]|nr:trypsin-like peptidase domain-containing protein [Planctomycetota bacterium]MDA1248565.1 trypsin-like peptidase domain-containing protein [Planctomycetota bacterium]